MAMDFFERQDQARRSTKWLVLYFAAGVTLLVLAVYLAVAVVCVGADSQRQRSPFVEQTQVRLWNAPLFFGVAVGTLVVIAVGSLSKTLELARGGGAVATMLGGRPVNPSTTDPDERKLLNVVEEMALAAGVPVPQVYLLPAERGINAFAAGHSTSDAVVAVTQGALKLLSRDELQGVIGHEFSHIVNGDMRLNVRLIGVVFGILCLTVIGRILLQTRGRKNPLPLFGLVLILIGWVGVFFGRLIQAAVSRRREVLADASAVQFTRNPAGLAGALKKIGGLAAGSKLENPHAEEASHLFFGNGMGESFLHLLETHPPLEERIRALEPDFDGVFPRVGAATVATSAELSPALAALSSALDAQARSFGGGRAMGTGGQVAGQAELRATPPPIPARFVVANAGAPTPEHLQYAEDLRDAIPQELRTAAREPLGACTLVYALLLSDEEAVRGKQLEELAGATSASLRQETERVWPQVRVVGTHAKLPLVDLALPGLRQISSAQFTQFRRAVQALVESDGEIDLFEYVLQKIVLRHLEPHFTTARKPIVQYYALKPLAGDCAVLLSALAYLGEDDDEKAAAAFELGAQQLSYAAQARIQLLPAEASDLSQVDTALERLAQAVPQIKKNVLNACGQVVAADGLVQEAEAELLRGIADTLDCPLPPFIARNPATP
jgi:Zn-dependent protease with chaperone function